jgi:hypothetical protein
MKTQSPEDKLVDIYACNGIHSLILKYNIIPESQELPQSVSNPKILASNFFQLTFSHARSERIDSCNSM